VDALLPLFPPGSALDGDSMLLIGGCGTDELAEGRYNGNRWIPVVFVADGVTRLAVCRETWPP
jgi:hypothetical protein